MTNENRIYFIDNPYPEGHRISEFIWSGRIDDDENLWFDFHLISDKYCSEDKDYDYYDDEIDEDEEDAWQMKAAWYDNNNCILSSTYWSDQKGIRLNNGTKKINFESIFEKELKADILPLSNDFDYEDLAFHINLQGHDSCADHKIRFSNNNNIYNIEWTGKIALTYSGDYEFKHEFKILVRNIKFNGFHYPKQWTMDKASEIFEKNLEDFNDFEFVDINPKSNVRQYKLNKIEK